MDIKREKIYTKNNVQRWAHCLLRKVKCVPDNKSIYYHYHDYIELLYFVEGEGSVLINDKVLEVRPGSTVIVNAQKAHATCLETDAVFYCIKFLPGILYDNEQSLWDFKYVLPFISGEEDNYVLSAEDTRGTAIEPLLAEIMEEWEDESYAYELVIRANILKLISIIFRIWERKGVTVDHHEMPEIIKKAVIYTVENHSTATMQDTAEHCGLSYNYFSHLFHSSVGMSYSEYIITVRVNAAERLLTSGNDSITEIAAETGFSSASHFISCFSKIKGITPAKFRKELNRSRGVEHRKE
ncbi:MAG: helix-turn-helix domain-containing protein [Ruminococcaceae bacterium]|nr:helix-turn-helix domain-containing protein [Oscillospiraceae bacterium]